MLEHSDYTRTYSVSNIFLRLGILSFLCLTILSLQAQWKELGPLHSPIKSMAYDGSTYLYAASQYGIYRSADNGDHWTLWRKHENGDLNATESYSADENGFGLINGEIYAVAYDWNVLYGWRNDPPYLVSTDPNLNWTPLCQEDFEECIEGNELVDMVSIGNRLVAATFRGIYYINVPIGEDVLWEYGGATLSKLFVDGAMIIGSNSVGGIFVSADSGASWTPYSGGNLPGEASAFAKKGNRLFAVVPGHGVCTSLSGGAWVMRNSGLPSLDCIGIAELNGKIYVATANDWVWKTSNNGNSWTEVRQVGKPVFPLTSLHSLNGSLFAGAANGIFRNSGGSNSWDQLIDGLSNAEIDWMAVNPDNQIFAANNIQASFSSESHTESWIYTATRPWKNKVWEHTPLLRSDRIRLFQQDRNVIYMLDNQDEYEPGPQLYNYLVSGSEFVYGLDWCWYDLLLDHVCDWDNNIVSFASFGDYLFYATSSPSDGIGISSTRGSNDFDDTVFPFTYSFSLPHRVNKLRTGYSNGSFLIAYTVNGIYHSMDSAQSWQPAGLQGYDVKELIEANDFQVAVTSSGALRYSELNPGLGWVAIPESPEIWMKHVLYRRSGNLIRYSTDDGDTWQNLSIAPNMGTVRTLAAAGNDRLLVGTADRGIWSHPLVSANPARKASPESVDPFAVYPNPSEDFFVGKSEIGGRLDLLDVNGKLLHSRQLMESQEAKVSTKDLTVGVYVLRLTSTQGVQVQKIVKE